MNCSCTQEGRKVGSEVDGDTVSLHTRASPLYVLLLPCGASVSVTGNDIASFELAVFLRPNVLNNHNDSIVRLFVVNDRLAELLLSAKLLGKVSKEGFEHVLGKPESL